MGCVYARYKTLWIKFKDRTGAWTYRRTEYKLGQEDHARKLLRRVEEKIASGASVELGPITVRRYSDKWIKDCREMGIGEWKNNEARLRLHVLPTLGDTPIEDVRPRHIAELFKSLRKRGKHAPKTIRNIYSALQGMFREAAVEGLTDTSPCVLTEHHLGPIEDKKSGWRETAVFGRPELALLILDSRVAWDRRVLYALEGIGGLRHGEAAGLRWFHYDAAMEPLGRITVSTSYNRGKTKTRKTRYMPVHPVLANVLDEWRKVGWVEMMGREPNPDDLIVPCPKRERRPLGVMRDKNYSRKRFIEDLATLELRHRRGHDLRRTMISLARSDGARKDLLELCTHTPKKDAAIDMYTTIEWPSLCLEVGKLKVQILDAATCDQLREEALKNRDARDGILSRPCPVSSNPRGKMVEAPGIEARCWTTADQGSWSILPRDGVAFKGCARKGPRWRRVFCPEVGRGVNQGGPRLFPGPLCTLTGRSG